MQCKTRLQNIQQKTNRIQKIQQNMEQTCTCVLYQWSQIPSCMVRIWKDSCEHSHNACIQGVKLWLGRLYQRNRRSFESYLQSRPVPLVTFSRDQTGCRIFTLKFSLDQGDWRNQRYHSTRDHRQHVVFLTSNIAKTWKDLCEHPRHVTYLKWEMNGVLCHTTSLLGCTGPATA